MISHLHMQIGSEDSEYNFTKPFTEFALCQILLKVFFIMLTILTFIIRRYYGMVSKVRIVSQINKSFSDHQVLVDQDLTYLNFLPAYDNHMSDLYMQIEKPGGIRS